MTRPLAADFLTNLGYDTIRPAFLFSLKHAAGTLYYWTGRGNKTWNGHTWIGDGTFNGISDYKESNGSDPESIEVYFAGESVSLISLFLNSIQQGGDANLWFALMTEGQNIVADPHNFFVGELDTFELDDSNDEASITMELRNLLIASRSEVELRYTDACANLLHPGDKGFMYVAQVAEWSGWWGFPEQQKTSPSKKDLPPPPVVRAK